MDPSCRQEQQIARDRDAAGANTGIADQAARLTRFVTDRAEFERLVEYIPAFVLLLNRDHTIAFANRQFRALFPDVADSFCCLVHNKDRACAVCPVMDEQARDTTSIMEWRAPDGRVFALYNTPFTGQSGQTQTLQIGIDITERARMTEELARLRAELEQRVHDRTAELRQSLRQVRQAEERYRIIADYTFDWETWELPDGQLAYVSPSIEQVTGYPPTAFPTVAAMMDTVLHPDDRAVWAQHSQRVQAGDCPETIVFRVRGRDGDIRWIEHVCRAVTSDTGTPRGRRASNRDITARMQAEARARQHLETLSHATRVTAMGELAGSLAHQLNQPLTGIVANARAGTRFLEQVPPDLQEVHDVLSDIAEDALRAGEIIRHMRQLLQRGRQERAPVALDTLVAETVKLLASETVIRNVRLTHRCAPDTPAVNGDRVQLQQVLLNLVINAAQAAAGAAAPAVHIETAADSGGALIQVTDNGTGIAPDTMAKMFDAFHTTKEDGLGLGLAVCRSIVQAHGGEIRATNNPGAGATFTVRLPLTT